MQMPKTPGGENAEFIQETGKWVFKDQDGVSFEHDDKLNAW